MTSHVEETKYELFHILIKWNGDPESPNFRSFIYDLLPLTRDTAGIVFDYIVMEIEDVTTTMHNVNINDAFLFSIDTRIRQWKNIPEITLPMHGIIRHSLDGYNPHAWELNVFAAGWLWIREIGEPSPNANLILRYYDNKIELESAYGTLILPPNKNDISWRRKL